MKFGSDVRRLSIAAFAAAAPFVLGEVHGRRAPRQETHAPALTMHDWEAKHYVLAAVIILVVMGLFAYSWA